MNIERYSLAVPDHAIKFCLDQLTEAPRFKDVKWNTEVVNNLTMEEIIGALVSAENLVSVAKDMLNFMKNAPASYANGNEASGVDEGETKAHQMIDEFERIIKEY